MENQKQTLLLVEDDQMIVDMYKMRFEDEGFEVLVTDKGSQALDWAKEKKPAAILLDIILPETDGFSVLQTLKNETITKSIPVLLLTNLGQESDKTKGQEYGASDYFVKSQHTPAEIIQKIKELIR